MADCIQTPSDDSLILETRSENLSLASPPSFQAALSASVISPAATSTDSFIQNTSASSIEETFALSSKDTSVQNSTYIHNSKSVQDTSTSPIEDAFPLVTIDDVKQRTMFWSLFSVFQNANQQDGRVNLLGTDMESLKKRLHQADYMVKMGIRTREDLVVCREVMEQMLQIRSPFLADAVEIFLIASRQPDWHYAFGDAGILSFLLHVVATYTASDSILDFALRTIGNTCIDNNVNRQIVVENNGLEGIIRQLDNPLVSEIIVPVLHNICDDSVSAQKLSLENGVYTKLMKRLSESFTTPTPFFDYLCTLLELLTENYDAETSSDGTMEILFQAALQRDLEFEDFCSLFTVILGHLQAKRNQSYIIDHDMVPLALTLLHQSYSQQGSTSSSDAPPAEQQQELKSMREGLVTVLADVSYCPEFATKYGGLESSATDTLMKWLTAHHPELQICACLMLGNMARSEQTCRIMTDRHQLYMIVFDLVKISSHSPLLFPALGFLGNLASLPDVKEYLGDMGIIPEMARFWTAELLAYVSIKLTWRVVKGSMGNVSRLLAPVPANDHSETYLSLVLSAYEKSHNSELKLEVGYLVHAILWTFYSSGVATSPDSKEALVPDMCRCHFNLAQPLALMVRNGNPEIRSKGWFAMALMARTLEGSIALDDVLHGEAFEALEATIRGQPSSLSTESTSATTEPGPETGTPDVAMILRVCRDNASVMVHEILKHGDAISDVRRGEFEELLQDRARPSETCLVADG